MNKKNDLFVHLRRLHQGKQATLRVVNIAPGLSWIRLY